MEGDAQLERLFAEHSFPLAEHRLRCRSGRPITRLCINRQCNHPSLHCSGDDCDQCSQTHDECESVKMNGLTRKLKEREDRNKDFIRRVFEIQDRLVQEIQNERRTIIRQFLVGDLEEKHRETIERVYFRGDAECLRGRQAHQFYQKLRAPTTAVNRELCTAILEQFTAETVRTIGKFKAIKQNLLVQFARGQRMLRIESKVLNIQQSFFIAKLLQKPAQLKLLFRASEHNFGTSQFHKICDGKAPTLVVVRTNFGKTLGAYTPKPWKRCNAGEWIADPSGASFMFSCDLKEKFALQDKNKSICCYSNYGPCFGAGSILGGGDLDLKDGSGNNNGFVNFPSSYSGNGRKNNQETWTALIGNPKGNQFTALEWEVFLVEFMQ